MEIQPVWQEPNCGPLSGVMEHALPREPEVISSGTPEPQNGAFEVTSSWRRQSSLNMAKVPASPDGICGMHVSKRCLGLWSK